MLLSDTISINPISIVLYGELLFCTEINRYYQNIETKIAIIAIRINSMSMTPLLCIKSRDHTWFIWWTDIMLYKPMVITRCCRAWESALVAIDVRIQHSSTLNAFGHKCWNKHMIKHIKVFGITWVYTITSKMLLVLVSLSLFINQLV